MLFHYYLQYYLIYITLWICSQFMKPIIFGVIIYIYFYFFSISKDCIIYVQVTKFKKLKFLSLYK